MISQDVLVTEIMGMRMEDIHDEECMSLVIHLASLSTVTDLTVTDTLKVSADLLKIANHVGNSAVVDILTKSKNSNIRGLIEGGKSVILEPVVSDKLVLTAEKFVARKKVNHLFHNEELLELLNKANTIRTIEQALASKIQYLNQASNPTYKEVDYESRIF